MRPSSCHPHNIIDVVLNVYEKKEVSGLPLVVVPLSPAPIPLKKPLIRGRVVTSSSEDSTTSTSSSESLSESDVITIHLNERRTVSSNSSDSWDDSKGKGKEKEKERLNPKKSEKKRLEKSQQIFPPSLNSTKPASKWSGSNEVFLLKRSDNSLQIGKPMALRLFSDLVGDEEGKDKTCEDLIPCYTEGPIPSVARRVLRDHQRKQNVSAPPSPYAKELRQLADMGFKGAQVEELLAQYDGNIANVVDRLLS